MGLQPGGLVPAPPPDHRLQRRLFKCPHTGAVRMAFSRTGPSAPATCSAPAAPPCSPMGTALLQLHASKCSARVRQLPRRRLPNVAAVAAAAVSAGAGETREEPARKSHTVIRSTSARTLAKTLAAEHGRGAAATVARELVGAVVDAVVADFAFEDLLAGGEARVSAAERAARSARVHDGHGYRCHAKERLMERMNTPGRASTARSSAQRMASTEDASTSQQASRPARYGRPPPTPPADWGFATADLTTEVAMEVGHRARESTPRATDAARQRYARQRIGLQSAVEPWTAAAASGHSSGAPQPRQPRQPRQARQARQPHEPHEPQPHVGRPRPQFAAPTARVSVPAGLPRGRAVLTARVWARQSTPETRRVPDPVARPFPFAGSSPFPATARDDYVYPAIPNHYHLALKVAADHGDDRPSTPLGEASYASVQIAQFAERRVAHGSHTQAAHAVEQLLRAREGPSSRWVKTPTGRFVVASATKPAKVGSMHWAEQAWNAAIEQPLGVRGCSRGSSGGGLVATPLTVRHLLSAGAIK
jgi:hypothetical protein